MFALKYAMLEVSTSGRKIPGGVDANASIKHTHCDLQNLKLIAVAVYASLFSI